MSQVSDFRDRPRRARATDVATDGFGGEPVDLVIVGAGTAGAAAAAFCAGAGMRVVCLERASLDVAGARWVNGVPAWAFTEAGLALPAGDELRGADSDFHLVAGWGPRRLVIRQHGGLEVDMRHLVARLHHLARDRGASLIGHTAVRGVEHTGGSTSELHTDRGVIRSRWIVDASGLAGAGLLPRPQVAPWDLCSAAQQVHRVRDMSAARGFFEGHGVGPGEILCFTGIAGGFSILSARYESDEVSLLTGSITADGWPSGKRVLDDFLARESWIGEPIFGGARAIPLRRPHDRLTDGRVALLGDAACQVYPAHGSGIGAGLIAARFLADALRDGRGLHGYAVAWQRALGGKLAMSDLFRRFSQGLGPGDVEALIASGLLDEDLARAGLSQQTPRLGPAALVGKARALVRQPSLARALAGTIARMLAVRGLYAVYPRDPRRIPAWSRAVERVYG